MQDDSQQSNALAFCGRAWAALSLDGETKWINNLLSHNKKRWTHKLLLELSILGQGRSLLHYGGESSQKGCNSLANAYLRTFTLSDCYWQWFAQFCHRPLGFFQIETNSTGEWSGSWIRNLWDFSKESEFVRSIRWTIFNTKVSSGEYGQPTSWINWFGSSKRSVGRVQKSSSQTLAESSQARLR